MVKKIYAGIGSRETPPDKLAAFSLIAAAAALQGWVLRSGGAGGADSAFEHGCNVMKGDKEIFLPWPGFNDSKVPFVEIPPEAFDIAEKIVPWWSNCSEGARKLHARNVMQVLGARLDDPVEMVVCWTEGGKEKGGTRTAIVLAQKHKIPVYNFGSNDGERLFLEAHGMVLRAEILNPGRWSTQPKINHTTKNVV